MKKICFVILHYNEKSLEDTFECVESIRISCKNYENQYQMIIVENGSGDSSASVLNGKYQFDSDVDVIVSQENLGFAKGNNLGCDFAKTKYIPEFLVVINNDTVLKQQSFLELIEKKYQEYHFDMLGPYIFDRNMQPQNPVPNLLTSLEEVESQIEILKNLSDKSSKKYKIKQYFKRFKILKIIKLKLRNNRNNEVFSLSKEEVKGIGLHGSALVFSKKYYEKYKDVFYSETFMFIEEDILFYRVNRDNLVSVYCPELEIYHKEDKSTEAVYGDGDLQNAWKIKNVLNSLEILKKMMKE